MVGSLCFQTGGFSKPLKSCPKVCEKRESNSNKKTFDFKFESVKKDTCFKTHQDFYTDHMHSPRPCGALNWYGQGGRQLMRLLSQWLKSAYHIRAYQYGMAHVPTDLIRYITTRRYKCSQNGKRKGNRANHEENDWACNSKSTSFLNLRWGCPVFCPFQTHMHAGTRACAAAGRALAICLYYGVSNCLFLSLFVFL